MSPRPATGSAVWSGDDLTNQTDWIFAIDGEIQRDLEAIAQRAVARGATCDDLALDAEPGPALAHMASVIRRELLSGRGFILLRGLRLDGRTEAEIGMLYSALGACLGVAVSQSAEGDRLGHVIDRGLGDQGRYYTRGGQLEFHMDPVDVVGLLCLHKAMSGGASRIVSALAVHNAILDERPDLLALLRRGFHNSRRPEGEPPTPHRVPVFDEGGGGTECYYLPVTIRQAAEEGFPLTTDERAALDWLARTADHPALRLDMDMREGDIQFPQQPQDSPRAHRLRRSSRSGAVAPPAAAVADDARLAGASGGDERSRRRSQRRRRPAAAKRGDCTVSLGSQNRRHRAACAARDAYRASDLQ
jgi:hypothetical protein